MLVAVSLGSLDWILAEDEEVHGGEIFTGFDHFSFYYLASNYKVKNYRQIPKLI
jgi:hypothetical protein